MVCHTLTPSQVQVHASIIIKNRDANSAGVQVSVHTIENVGGVSSAVVKNVDNAKSINKCEAECGGVWGGGNRGIGV